MQRQSSVMRCGALGALQNTNQIQIRIVIAHDTEANAPCILVLIFLKK
jgi:hypothetical protein